MITPDCKAGYHEECQAKPGMSLYPCKCPCHYQETSS